MRLKLTKCDLVNGELVTTPIIVDAPAGWANIRDDAHDGEIRLRDAHGQWRELVFDANESAVVAVGADDEITLPIVLAATTLSA